MCKRKQWQDVLLPITLYDFFTFLALVLLRLTSSPSTVQTRIIQFPRIYTFWFTTFFRNEGRRTRIEMSFWLLRKKRTSTRSDIFSNHQRRPAAPPSDCIVLLCRWLQHNLGLVNQSDLFLFCWKKASNMNNFWHIVVKYSLFNTKGNAEVTFFLPLIILITHSLILFGRYDITHQIQTSFYLKITFHFQVTSYNTLKNEGKKNHFKKQFIMFIHSIPYFF